MQEVRILYNFVGNCKKFRKHICSYPADAVSFNIRFSSLEISGKTIFFPRAWSCSIRFIFVLISVCKEYLTGTGLLFRGMYMIKIFFCNWKHIL